MESKKQENKAQKKFFKNFKFFFKKWCKMLAIIF